MSSNTKIEWATKAWNPLRGCSKVSEGCRNCYAIRQANRFSGPGMPYEGLTEKGQSGPNWTGKIRLVPEALDEPLRWRKPERVFVNSMSDLFHPNVPFDYIDQVFAVMALAPQHTFQVLTKRPERMMEYFQREELDDTLGHEAMYLYEQFGGRGDCSLAAGLIHVPGKISNHLAIPTHPKAWPLPNVWLGVSVENQKAADERIHLLNKAPAAVRFLSCEPLLGPLDIRVHLRWKSSRDWETPLINWIIVGGESGPGARPMNPDWARNLRDQCQAAGVAFFFKQWGEYVRCDYEGNDYGAKYIDSQCIDGELWDLDKCDGNGRLYSSGDNLICPNCKGKGFVRVGKKSAGRMLDGRTWDEFPEVQV